VLPQAAASTGVTGEVPRRATVGASVVTDVAAKRLWLLPQRGDLRNRWQAVANALFTMRSDRQPVATGGNGFGLISRIGRQRDLRPVATGCDHGAP